MKRLAFFNNKGGVGKTTLLYHVAYMLVERGFRVLVADLDPQANATSMFIAEDELIGLWPEPGAPHTIYGAIQPIVKGIGDISLPDYLSFSERLFLIAGDLELSTFEDRLSEAWPRCYNRDEAAFRTMTAFHRAIEIVAVREQVDWVLIDVGPNLGATNRAALITSDYVVVPVGPDLFSLQGLRNLGPRLRSWRDSWNELKERCPSPDIPLPSGSMQPLGYVVLQHGIRDNRPPKAYQHWIDQFPSTYRQAVLGLPPIAGLDAEEDENCLATIKHYQSLMPMAMDARKPVFALKPADGAIGAHGAAVRRAHDDFENLVLRIEWLTGPEKDY